MKYVLISGVVLFGCILVLGPMTDTIALPAGVVGIMDDLGSIF
jgi:hypothetical protein